MNTKKTVLNENDINIKDLEEAKKILLRGGLVAFPTETVYGLGGNALDPEASKKIYEAKGRPQDNPLIVHVSCEEEIYPLVKEISASAKELMNRYWPGPMTLVFKKSDAVPKETTGGLDTVAIRMPSHPVARKLISFSQVPIAAPSANTSTRPSPTCAKHVVDDLDGKIDMIIDGGECEIGLESTIIDVSGDEAVLLRPGYISLEEIINVCGGARYDGGIFEKPKEDFAPKAPGMKYRHYAPLATMTIIKGDIDKVSKKISTLARSEKDAGKKVGVICGTEIEIEEGCADKVLVYGNVDDGKAAAKNLYKILRQMDDEKIDVIFASSYEGEMMKAAIKNRMLKAAGYIEIEA